jgi:hypothetical protein
MLKNQWPPEPNDEKEQRWLNIAIGVLTVIAVLQMIFAPKEPALDAETRWRIVNGGQSR